MRRVQPHPCPVCGKPIQLRRQICCSIACSRALNKPKYGTCPICGAPLKRKNQKYCSYACAGKVKQNYKICVICGKKFLSSPSARVSTCGDPTCTATFNRGISFAVGSAKYLSDYKKTTQPEHLPQSKSWVLQAPNGKIYECTDLSNFVRENLDLFDNKRHSQICNELYCLKASILGTNAPRRRRSEWHGWKVLSWGEPNKKVVTPKPQLYTFPTDDTLLKKSMDCKNCTNRNKIAICSPHGEIYCPPSLLDFVRKNCEAFFGLEPTEKNAKNIAAAFSRLKKSSKTTRKDGAPFHIYGGWTVIPCDAISKLGEKDGKNDR